MFARASMIDVTQTAVPGCIELALPRFDDDRGTFVKTVQHSVFHELGLPVDFVEQFHSHSRRGVVRGLHFQSPPYEFDKLVTCVAGEAWDVVVDLRAGSPTFGAHTAVGLSAARANAVFVPVGCAHGFLSLREDTVLSYWVTAEHSQDHDDGIRWDSMGIDWPLERPPILSARDASLPLFADHETPFVYAL
jgi:dTDP-4-dehydrorhamnose 3,5-epimerase